jgi:hypothetical protein
MIEVARIIAKGDPPDWLVAGLEEYRFIEVFSDASPAENHQRLIDDVRRAEHATATLSQLLPRLRYLVVEWSDDEEEQSYEDQELGTVIDQLIEFLPVINDRLKHSMPAEHRGRWRNTKREFCALVVIEAWKAVHGKAELRSLELYRACDAYWIACGGEQLPDIENWRHTIKSIPKIVAAVWGAQMQETFQVGKECPQNIVHS